MPLLEDPSIQDYSLLAIQEPWKNPFLQTSYNPSTSNFSLAYMPHPDTRVAFYINKQIDTSSWEVDFISPDLIHLKLSLTDDLRTRMVHIFNIYNPSPLLYRSISSLLTLLALCEAC